MTYNNYIQHFVSACRIVYRNVISRIPSYFFGCVGLIHIIQYDTIWYYTTHKWSLLYFFKSPRRVSIVFRKIIIVLIQLIVHFKYKQRTRQFIFMQAAILSQINVHFISICNWTFYYHIVIIHLLSRVRFMWKCGCKFSCNEWQHTFSDLACSYFFQRKQNKKLWTMMYAEIQKYV